MTNTKPIQTFLCALGAVLLLGCGSQAPIMVTCNTSPEKKTGPDRASNTGDEPRDATQSPAPEVSDSPWWDHPYPSKFDAPAASKKASVIRVKGNKFVDKNGKTIIFQGVNIADPDKVFREGHWTRKLFEVIRSWGANVVRVPIHPAAWRGAGKAHYFELIDQAIVWAGELDLYLIIEWHSIGNLVTGLFQHPMYDTSLQETYAFWRSISFRYQGIPTVAFYELFNEPTVFNGNLGHASWEQWKAINEEIIDIIYSHDRQVIPLVGGFNWAYDLRPIKEAPIEREGIGYVSHPYPQKTTAPFEKNWDAGFGFAAEKYPLFATEIGYMPPDAPGAHDPVRDDGSYGKRMTDYLAKKGASWTAWCFHPLWAPQLISDWEFTPTDAGNHFKSVMQKHTSEKKTK